MIDRQLQNADRLAPEPRFWWWEWEAAALGLLVLGIYFTRLTAVPVVGEESRWAAAAREMIATGDWIVPRQQGTIFPERPPLGSWLMALTGMARDEVDLAAVRLPSAFAILLLTWLIYAYSRSWMSRLGSFSSAAAFLTMGQVLQLGRSGESEAVFTLFVAGSLMIWHWGYVRGWSIALTWSLGYTFAALAALTKGPQAPVYFAAACGLYLLLRRDWRWLISWGHLAGMACFALVVGAWLIPFALTSGWQAVDDIWTQLAEDRYHLAGLARHLVTYPFETFGCLLPWSPMLLMLLKPSVARSLFTRRPQLQFLLLALVITYPTVWFAAAARGRYFMPLYPCVAVMIGLVIEHCTHSASAFDRRAWRHFLIGLGVIILGSGFGLVAVRFVPLEQLRNARQPIGFLVAWTIAAIVGGSVVLWAARTERSPRPQVAIVTIAAFMGLAYAGAMVNSRVNGGNDLTPEIARIKSQLTEPGRIVSFGRVYHRFAYEYGSPIRQISWPAADKTPVDISYFCFDRRLGDPTQRRELAKLPFEWDVVAEIPCDTVRRDQPESVVVIGRVRPPVIATQQDVSRAVRR